jgi:hypothetical protein
MCYALAHFGYKDPLSTALHVFAGATVWLLIYYLQLGPKSAELFFKGVGRILAHPRVTAALIARAKRTPYSHVDGYMERYWLFNPWGKDNIKKYPRLPSIRIQRLLREDRAAHHHDHPYKARSFILRGWYQETRFQDHGGYRIIKNGMYRAGDTNFIEATDWHTITRVSNFTEWTLFITWPRVQRWGFLVDGVKVFNTDYNGER